MSLTRNNLYQFLKSNILFQKQACFEFRYPLLFENDSFLIDQLNFPHLDTNIGNIFIDGFSVPIHSTAKFDNQLTFNMYVEERFLETKYLWIFNLITSSEDLSMLEGDSTENYELSTATIIPCTTDLNDNNLTLKRYGNVIKLYNTRIKSISMSGGFTANSIALAKFDVTITYSHFDIKKGLNN